MSPFVANSLGLRENDAMISCYYIYKLLLADDAL
jgi:hypothetical protein